MIKEYVYLVDVIEKRICNINDCKIQPSYNNPGELKRIFCKQHSQDGMIHSVNKKCKFDECKIQPRYNNPGETKGLYCKKHKEKNMVDVIEKRTCKFEGCKIRPNYNKPGLKPEWCKKHKEENSSKICDANKFLLTVKIFDIFLVLYKLSKYNPLFFFNNFAGSELLLSI